MACARARCPYGVSPVMCGTWSSSRKPSKPTAISCRMTAAASYDPFADEALREARHRPLHLPQVHVEDAAAGTQQLDGAVHRVRPADHLRHRAQAQVHAPGRAAVGPLHRPREVLGRGEQPRHATDGGHGRVVRMERQAHAGGLRGRQHRIQEAAVVQAHLLERRGLRGRRLGIDHLVAQRHEVRVEGGDRGAAAAGRVEVRAPHERGHEVVAQQPDADAAHVADRARSSAPAGPPSRAGPASPCRRTRPARSPAPRAPGPPRPPGRAVGAGRPRASSPSSPGIAGVFIWNVVTPSWRAQAVVSGSTTWTCPTPMRMRCAVMP